jgi:transcriptional regulator of acetoin/glycerol metabolism
MVRSFFIVVSDDQALVQKAQQFGQMHGVQVQTWTPEQYDAKMSTGTTEVPSLVPGSSAVESAKVLPFPGTPGYTSPADNKRSVATINQLESAAIENAIAAFKGNLTEAAKALGIGRATLYRKVKQYNIDPSAARKKKAA